MSVNHQSNRSVDIPKHNRLQILRPSILRRKNIQKQTILTLPRRRQSRIIKELILFYSRLTTHCHHKSVQTPFSPFPDSFSGRLLGVQGPSRGSLTKRSGLKRRQPFRATPRLTELLQTTRRQTLRNKWLIPSLRFLRRCESKSTQGRLSEWDAEVCVCKRCESRLIGY